MWEPSAGPGMRLTKRLRAAVSAILAVLTGATIWQGHYIAGYLEHMAQSLDQAQALVEKDEDWDQARRLSEDVFSMWETHKFHLHAAAQALYFFHHATFSPQ